MDDTSNFILKIMSLGNGYNSFLFFSTQSLKKLFNLELNSKLHLIISFLQKY